MSRLSHFQRDFAAGISSVAPLPGPMTVYRNTALLGAVEALAGNFPVTATIVGGRAFDALAVAHARACPPASPVLADYGRNFPSWLQDQAIARELPYLADVAHCERMWTEALNAADAPALDLASIETGDAGQLLTLRLKLHPAARFAWHATPAIDIWLAHQAAQVAEIAPEWRSCGALFARPALDVAAVRLGPAEHRLLCGVRLNEKLGEAAHAAATLYPDTDVGACFAALVQRGAFAANLQVRRQP